MLQGIALPEPIHVTVEIILSPHTFSIAVIHCLIGLHSDCTDFVPALTGTDLVLTGLAQPSNMIQFPHLVKTIFHLGFGVYQVLDPFSAFDLNYRGSRDMDVATGVLMFIPMLSSCARTREPFNSEILISSVGPRTSEASQLI